MPVQPLTGGPLRGGPKVWLKGITNPGCSGFVWRGTTGLMWVPVTSSLLALVVHWGSPNGVTQQSSDVYELWNLVYWIAIPSAPS